MGNKRFDIILYGSMSIFIIILLFMFPKAIERRNHAIERNDAILKELIEIKKTMKGE